MRSITAEKPRQQELEKAGHVTSTIKRSGYKAHSYFSSTTSACCHALCHDDNGLTFWTPFPPYPYSLTSALLPEDVLFLATVTSFLPASLYKAFCLLPAPESIAFGERSSKQGKKIGGKKGKRDGETGAPLQGPSTLYGLSLDEMRALTNQRVKFVLSLPLLKRVFQEQIRSIKEEETQEKVPIAGPDFYFMDEERRRNFISRSLALAEVVCIADTATCVKCGIISFLFGGTILNLGSSEHVIKWYQQLKELKCTGMFAMTEKGHGSNVRQIQTEATFDLDNQEFVIDTPCEDAQKMYIGNAMDGSCAVVFAQLIIEGKSQGPHCFIVPIRDEHGNLYPGVTAIDMMHKEGLNGVDNGILMFDKVRIPRENLLDKFGSVAPDGQYYSPIQNKSTRFNAMLATLTSSRLAVAFNAMSTMKMDMVVHDFNPSTQEAELGLTIAIRYSHRLKELHSSSFLIQWGTLKQHVPSWWIPRGNHLPHKHRCSQVFCQLRTFQMEERLSEAFSLGQFSLR
ncbi:hypothetical protein U0070_020215 [Myodes glareolus]|uniref:Acyl-CoA oxidase/dehydrogenase middle domain-containing protein n=1 Tax=Myodes glareolus TaxID=447135 RepID=A0AAW0HWB1_MYOGA